MKRIAFLSVAVLAGLAACAESPTGESDAPAFAEELVITPGAAAPVQARRPNRPLFSEAAAAANIGGSSTTPLSLTPATCAATASQQVVVTYSVTGRQANPASFQVNTRWEYDGSIWSGSIPATVSVPARAASAAPSIFQVTMTVVNTSTAAAGASTVDVVPFNLSTSAPAALDIVSTVTVHIAFTACAGNTAPTLVLPNNMTAEATSSAGAAVSFIVTATDAQDGNLTADVTCAPASGSTFALGVTTVTCSVTDAGGLTTTGSFTITVEDTTPAVFTAFPSDTVRLIAADIDGAQLNIGSLGIAVADAGQVSEPSTFSCDYLAGTTLGIGSTTTISCTATDAIGNESAPSSFDVFVGLNVNTQGFLAPLRMTAPISAHKRGSTVPHKFFAPTYADGTAAIDLAGDLRLVVVRQVTGDASVAALEANEYSTGSTAWRYDEGQYVFNLKTGTTAPWNEGTWATTVSYKGVTLATTRFELRR